MSPTPVSPAARRNAQRLRRRELFRRAAGGESRQALAAEFGLSPSAVQRALTRAAREQPPENRAIHEALQAERIRRALHLADQRIAEGDLNAVYALARLLPLLKDYEVFETKRTEFDVMLELYRKGGFAP